MNHRTLLSSAALVVAGLGSPLSANAAPQTPNLDAARLLEAMAANGQLSQSDALRLIRGALDNGEGPRVPVARSTDGRIGCLSEAMRLIKAWAKGKGVELQSVPPPSVGYVESPILPLRVYYQTEADKPVAEEVLKATETAWDNQIKQVGYPQPFTGDGQDPTPVPGLWTYVADTGMGGGGYTEWLFDIPLTPISDCSARVVIDRQNPSQVIGDVVAHEFNHTKRSRRGRTSQPRWRPTTSPTTGCSRGLSRRSRSTPNIPSTTGEIPMGIRIWRSTSTAPHCFRST
jgi:hypothetical protein